MFQDREAVEADPEAFDCDGCELRGQLASLDRENTFAWETYQRLNRQLLVALGAGGVVLQWALADCSPDEALDAFERMSIIHDTLQPPQKTD